MPGDYSLCAQETSSDSGHTAISLQLVQGQHVSLQEILLQVS